MISNIAKPSRTTRSAVSNGSRLHGGEVDGRTADARRFRDITAEIASDLGGSDSMSEAQRQLVRRAAMLSVQGEKMEADAIAGGAIDLDAFGALSDRLSRLFARLGVKRVARDATPTIDSIIARHAS